MIATTSLAKAYGARTLFEDVSLQLNAGQPLRPGRRQRLGQDHVPARPRRRRAGVRGDGVASPSGRASACSARTASSTTRTIILDLAMSGDAVVWDALAEQQRIADSGDHADAGRLADLEDRIAAHDGYTLEARASAVLEGLGIPIAVHRAPLATLSGGFKLRVLLAQVLVGGPDVLLLDEPTNHLDILSIRWLEKFLAGYDGCAVVISHDQRFLDNVATHMLDVDYGTITLYTGNYSAFDGREGGDRASARRPAIARAEDEIARKRAFVERFGAKATKATPGAEPPQADREDRGRGARGDARAARPRFRFVPERPSGRDVLELAGVSQGVRREAGAARRLAHRAARRAGRRSSARTASASRRCSRSRWSASPPTRARVRWGHEVRAGYFAQDHREVLDRRRDHAARRFWRRRVPARARPSCAASSGACCSRATTSTKKVGALSGGEAARLIFALLIGREAERARARRADQPPRPRGHRRARRGAQGVRRAR